MDHVAPVDNTDAPTSFDEAPALAPVVAPFKTFVSYAVATGTGQLMNSLVLSGIADILSEADIGNVRSTLANVHKVASPEAITLLFWKHLYA